MMEKTLIATVPTELLDKTTVWAHHQRVILQFWSDGTVTWIPRSEEQKQEAQKEKPYKFSYIGEDL